MRTHSVRTVHTHVRTVRTLSVRIVRNGSVRTSAAWVRTERTLCIRTVRKLHFFYTNYKSELTHQKFRKITLAVHFCKKV